MPREPLLNLPPVVSALCVAMAGIHAVRVFLLDAEQDFQLLLHLAFIPSLYSGQFAIDGWSYVAPISYTLLHGGFLHLAVNTVWLAAFGSPLANLLGPFRFVVFWAITGLAAAGLHFFLHASDQAPLIGASGAVSGMMGAAARYGFRTERARRGALFVGRPLSVVATLRSRNVVAFLGTWMAVNALTGIVGGVPGAEGGIAWEAHVGGFLAGFFGIGAFLSRPEDGLENRDRSAHHDSPESR